MKVSIITIVYNNKACIADCIRSVQSQTYEHIEHIVIDGGSTDGTRRVIEKYRDSLACYISEPDRGLYDALNKGIRQATGDVVGVLHSDDLFYEPQTIEKMVAEFRRTGADLVYANGMYVEKERLYSIRRVYKAKPYYKRYIPFGWIPLHTTIYVRRELFDQYGLYDDSYAIASDYEISLRWFQNTAISKHFHDEWVVKMRLGGKSTTAGLQKKKSSEDLDIIRRYQLPGLFTLGFKIARKIPQYVLPRVARLEVVGTRVRSGSRRFRALRRRWARNNTPGQLRQLNTQAARHQATHIRQKPGG